MSSVTGHCTTPYKGNSDTTVRKTKGRLKEEESEGVIDLNQVISHYQYENESNTIEEYGNESDSIEEYGNESETLEEYGNESNTIEEYGNETLKEDEYESKRPKLTEGELVYCEDDIPDDIFEQMLNNNDSQSLLPSLKEEKVPEKKRIQEEKIKKKERIIKERIQEKEESKGMIALILAPTRELALQVTEHIKAAACHTNIKVSY